MTGTERLWTITEVDTETSPWKLRALWGALEASGPAHAAGQAS
jgi:hypothetical protein